jgi:hypothetical protein
VKGKPGDSISTRPTEELAQHTLPSTIPVHQEGSRALQQRHGKGESSSDHESLDIQVNLEGKLLSAETLSLSTPKHQLTMASSGTAVITHVSSPPASSPPDSYDPVLASQPSSANRSPSSVIKRLDDIFGASEHLPVPRTPANPRHRQPSPASELPDYASEYYTAAWGSPYQLSPSSLLSQSARTAVIALPTPRRVPASASSTLFLAGSTSRRPSLHIRHLSYQLHTRRKRIPNILRAQEPSAGLRYLIDLYQEVSGTVTTLSSPLGAETSAFPQERVLEAGLPAVTRQEKRTEP